MSPEDVALCQQAIELANSGQKQAAYKQFCLSVALLETASNLASTTDILIAY